MPRQNPRQGTSGSDCADESLRSDEFLFLSVPDTTGVQRRMRLRDKGNPGVDVAQLRDCGYHAGDRDPGTSGTTQHVSRTGGEGRRPRVS